MALKGHRNIIKKYNDFERFIKKTIDLSHVIIQDINFLDKGIDWSVYEVDNTTFLGCKLDRKDTALIINGGGYVYPKFKGIPYKTNRLELYTWQELTERNETDNKTADFKIYEHFKSNQYAVSVNEALAQRIHDFSIDEALRQLITYREDGMTDKKCVGFMGGHSALRGDEFYVKTALSAQLATQKGYFIVSGGGPGVMEAANLGAYFAAYSEEDLLSAITILAEANHFSHENFGQKALEVLEKFPNGSESLAIPTWFYGHEPTNLFATHIAKYFSNSIREDTLLAISLYGVVFAPGSAGTTQEIFQEAAQNHYGTYGFHSPMIFLSKKRYVEDTSIYSVLHQLAQGKPYKDLLFLTDDPHLVVDWLENHPPIRAAK